MALPSRGGPSARGPTSCLLVQGENADDIMGHNGFGNRQRGVGIVSISGCRWALLGSATEQSVGARYAFLDRRYGRDTDGHNTLPELCRFGHDASGVLLSATDTAATPPREACFPHTRVDKCVSRSRQVNTGCISNASGIQCSAAVSARGSNHLHSTALFGGNEARTEV